MRILLALLLCLPSFGQQNPNRPRNIGEVPRIYISTCTVTLSSAATACTIQQPATGANNVRLMYAQVYCSVACTATQERNGTAATATAGTVKRVNPDRTDTITANIFSASDVGVGTAFVVKPLVAGTTIVKLDGIYLIGNGTAKNYTVRIASMTGDVAIAFEWEEYN